MNILITNYQEAEMPEDKAGHCRILLERRIDNKFPDELPGPGADVTILYSEKDPLWETIDYDDHSYFIYMTVEKVELPEGADRDEATVYVKLEF
jgi:hypothetical protein